MEKPASVDLTPFEPISLILFFIFYLTIFISTVTTFVSDCYYQLVKATLIERTCVQCYKFYFIKEKKFLFLFYLYSVC